MPSSAASKRFLEIYDALPSDAQQLLVRKQLAPLLNAVSKNRRNRATASATQIQRRYARMPTLNLKAKKAEIAILLLELSRDSKRAIIKERSRREQLLSEAVESLASWLNDIWRVVFEFRTNFRVAHACLLFACDALDQIGSASGGCRCSYASMFIPVKITRSTGKVVKSFTLSGAHNLDKVMLWIWRDLFVTILAAGTKRQRSIVPDMIDDIRILLGWRALEQLLRGGNKPAGEDGHEDDEDDEDDLGGQDSDHSTEKSDIVDDDGDQDYISDNWSSIYDDLYPPSLYAAHWSWRIADQQPRLRDIVHTALLNIFKVAPSGPLFTTMISIADDGDELEEGLHPILMSVAGYSCDNFTAALRILALNNRTDSLNSLLRTHKHLLRPQDATSLQFAVLIMSSNFSHRAHSVSIIEEELTDVAEVFRAAVRFCFCNIDSEINKMELTQILTLREGSTNRHTRMTRWVKSVATPQADNPHPMALAALMMGLPVPPGADGADEGDMLGYFEVDGDDSEAEDLREEFRPNIKARLQGWVDTAVAVKGAQSVLAKVYTKIIADMPFLKASDVVEEMYQRMADRPSKVHVADALETFREFCQRQYLTLALARGKSIARRGSASANRAGRMRSGPVPGPGPSPSSPVPQGTLHHSSDTIEDVD